MVCQVCSDHKHKRPWDASTCKRAAFDGHLQCLDYAREHGCPWDFQTCAVAARNGNMNCLAYAHERGCPWDVRTCAFAVLNGRLHCLIYAHERGCPWDSSICACAALTGHMDCLAYATHHGASWRTVPYGLTEKVVRRWHSLRVIARRALSIRRKRAQRAASTLAHAWLEYAYAPIAGRPGYERMKSDYALQTSRHAHT